VQSGTRLGDWSPDGRRFAFSVVSPDSGNDIWLLEPGENASAKPFVKSALKATRDIAEKTVDAAKPAVSKAADATAEAARKVKEKTRSR